MQSINDQYLDAAIKYLSVLMEQKIELTQVKGMDAYLFSCPFCTQYVRSTDARERKTAALIQVRPNEWIFNCHRGFSSDCRGGYRSFYNFLLMLHPQLFNEYQIALAMRDSRNHHAIRAYKNRSTF